MDITLQTYFEKHSIKYIEHKHTAIFTVAESKEKIKEHIPGLHTKNLFLKDDKGRFYLICMPGDKRLNIKFLEKYFNLKKLKFADAEDLKSELNLTPGSVSLFGMIYAKNTFLVIDKEVWDAEITGFHPNVNTATLEISHADLEKFYNSLECKKEIIKIE